MNVSAVYIAVKTVVVKGKASVDPECAVHSTMHIFCEGGDLYDVMLNQVLSISGTTVLYDGNYYSSLI